MKKSMQLNRCGFTLVELSIVLVIIGLIVGGVVGGQSLIKSARMQAVIKEINQIKTAHNTFVLQYDALPGDFADATEYWPDLTSEGNGDGVVALNNFRYGMATEGQHAFRHLSLAEIFPMDTSELYPTSSWGNGLGYAYFYRNNGPLFSNTFMIGKNTSGYTPGHRFNNGGFTPADAKRLDTKIDDGIPNRGKIRGIGTPYSWSSPNCATAEPHTPNTTESYRLDQTDPNCGILIITKDSTNIGNK